MFPPIKLYLVNRPNRAVAFSPRFVDSDTSPNLIKA